ncbi:Beclin-1-like protein like [Argiope bruennichi]|uniref:Beclin-1-like protein like n=1 Tax=Argiope bruennichi TaxID=94029 RepID=A0A8T0F6I6_ARGBR|nr:Beclin-1-like protein like [Argiope bruennichi]
MATNSVISEFEEYLSKDQILTVNHVCQRCSVPLGIPKDLNKQSVHSCQNAEEIDDIVFIDNFEMLTGNLMNGINYGHIDDYMARRDIIRPLLTRNNDIGRLNIELLDLMSSSPQVDHPICADCTDNILDHMDQELKDEEDEIEEYRKLLHRLEMEQQEEDVDGLRAELSKYEELSTSLEEELARLEFEKNGIKEQVKDLEKNCDILEMEANEMCIKENIFERHYNLYQDDILHLEKQITYVKYRFDKLDKIDALRFSFQILCDGNIGIINGHRLGRLPEIPVEWSEISAAWGQTVLLLHSLSKLVKFTIENLELIPMSNRSFVKLTQDNRTKLLPLFYSEDENDQTKQLEFDQAMAQFLTFLQKFKETIEESESFRLPYTIQRGKILDGRAETAYSIKSFLNTDENGQPL